MKFSQVFCSQCGEAFGPGNHGFSHCEDHREITLESRAAWRKDKHTNPDGARIIAAEAIAKATGEEK